MAAAIISHSRAREIASCDENGSITALVNLGTRIKVGDVITGTLSGDGYRRFMADGKNYLLHRFIWFWHRGFWPSAGLDHINRIKSDNRLCNLRLATQAENMQNQPLRSTNSSGHVGVRWHEARQKWQAYIMVNGKSISSFHSTKAEAIETRKQMELKYFKFQNPI